MSLPRRFINSAPVRKSKMLALKPYRGVIRAFASKDDYLDNPPIIVNSLPKSGTHLLLQMIRSLPETRYLSSFIAQTPSWTLKERDQATINKMIDAIIPREVVPAHLHYSPETENALKKINAIHFLIHRDPRDVAVSEAHYLATMNRWHALHSTFKSISDPQERIALSLKGLNTDYYPDAKTRYNKYLGWRKSDHCNLIKYEDLICSDIERAIKKIVRIFLDHQRKNFDSNIFTSKLKEAIAPEKSHTFHKGGTRWRNEMNKENQLLANSYFNEQ